MGDQANIRCVHRLALVLLFLLLALLQLVCSPTAIEDLLLHVIWLSAHALAALGGITTHVIVTLMSVSLLCSSEGVSPVPSLKSSPGLLCGCREARQHVLCLNK